MYFHALKQSAEQDNATPLESHSVGFEIQMRTEELVALFQVHLLYFCYGKVKKVKTLRIYLPKQCPFGPIPQSTWRRRKNPDFLWAGNRWRRGQRDLGLGSALTMLTTLVQKSFCQKTIHGPRRLGSQTQMQMRAQLHTQTHTDTDTIAEIFCAYMAALPTHTHVYTARWESGDRFTWTLSNSPQQQNLQQQQQQQQCQEIGIYTRSYLGTTCNRCES